VRLGEIGGLHVSGTLWTWRRGKYRLPLSWPVLQTCSVLGVYWGVDDVCLGEGFRRMRGPLLVRVNVASGTASPSQSRTPRLRILRRVAPLGNIGSKKCVQRTLPSSFTPCRFTPCRHRDFANSFIVIGWLGSIRPWSIHDWIRSRLMGDISTLNLHVTH
jgi:hypothetical protein